MNGRAAAGAETKLADAVLDRSTWTLALILALLMAKWDFFPGRTEGKEVLKTQGCESTEIKLSTRVHSPKEPPEMLTPVEPQELHLHRQQYSVAQVKTRGNKKNDNEVKKNLTS